MPLTHEKQRILIVDDELSNLKILDRMLQSRGYHNKVLISDPREVVSNYLKERPGLILLDLNMPFLNGYEVIEALKELGDPMLPPILVLTAQLERSYLLNALAAGARDYLTKPFDLSELLMRVRNLLDAHLAHRLLYDQNAVLEQIVAERTEEVRRTHREVLSRLGRAAEFRDNETGNHIQRMSLVSTILARAAGWSEPQCELLLHASPMHDIGKIGIPDAILLKPGKLIGEEWEIMKTHTTIGGRLLEGEGSDLLRLAKEIALSHHEKWDGSGYPYGLKGEQIPLSGRITAIADVFDALTSRRPYKKAWSIPDALSLIDSERHKHFDSDLVDLFFREQLLILQTIYEHAEPESTPNAPP